MIRSSVKACNIKETHRQQDVWIENSTEEPQCIAWSTVKIPAGSWSTAGGTETSEMLLRAAEEAV